MFRSSSEDSGCLDSERIADPAEAEAIEILPFGVKRSRLGYRTITIISQLPRTGGIVAPSRLSAFVHGSKVTCITRARDPCHLRNEGFEAHSHQEGLTK